MAKEKCDCGRMATYLYMPGFQDKENSFVCNDCISSTNDIGCSCNFRSINGEYSNKPEGIEGKDWRYVTFEGNEHMSKITKEDGIWIDLDERGRPYPCAEYDWSEDGFIVPTFFSDLADNISWKWFLFKEAFKVWWSDNICQEVPPDRDI